MPDATLLAAFKQLARAAGIVAVILEWVPHGFGDDGVGSEMHHAADGVLTDDPINRLGVADIADDERRIGDGLTKAGRQIVQNDHALAPCPQLLHNVAAYVSSSARNQYRPLARHVYTSSD